MNYQDKLKELIPLYKQNKMDADSYEKLAKKYNTEIKTIMLDNKLTEATDGDTKISCVVSQRQEFVEELLISTLKKLKIKGVVKKKEYVDMDALEDAIYNGLLNAAQLAPCQVTKEVVTLRMSNIKK